MFPMTPTLRAALERQRAYTRAIEHATGQVIPWVFHRDGKPIRYFRRAWLTACKAAGTPHRIPHDFRRTAVQNLERAGVPRSAAMKMVGHKTEAMYRRYAIADEAHGVLTPPVQFSRGRGRGPPAIAAREAGDDLAVRLRSWMPPPGRTHSRPALYGGASTVPDRRQTGGGFSKGYSLAGEASAARQGPTEARNRAEPSSPGRPGVGPGAIRAGRYMKRPPLMLSSAPVM